MRSKRKNQKKESKFESRKVRLHTLTRHWSEDGETFEYRDTISGPMPYCDLPKEAMPVTGTKDDYCVVDMEPNLPAYCGEVERDANGNPKKAHNFFDAQGYYTYAIDNRIKEAEQAATATMKRPRMDIDWKKVLTIAACAVVVVAVIWRFYA